MGLFSALFGPPKLNISQRFELLREENAGTMSKTLKVRERSSRQVFALKILDPQITAAFEARFKGLNKPSEGEISLQLQHPLIVRTLETGLTNSGETYLLMEYVQGIGLQRLIAAEDTRLQGRRHLIIRQMAQALAHLHEMGFLHRDVCPHNFIVEPDKPTVKLIDFGLSVPATKAFMGPGNRTGKTDYMAPELLRRMPTDGRVDVFAFGVTCYQLITGSMPWKVGGGEQAIARASAEPPPLAGIIPNINPMLAAGIEGCLRVDRDIRVRSFKEFLRRTDRVNSDTA